MAQANPSREYHCQRISAVSQWNNRQESRKIRLCVKIAIPVNFSWHKWLRRGHHPPCKFSLKSIQWGFVECNTFCNLLYCPFFVHTPTSNRCTYCYAEWLKDGPFTWVTSCAWGNCAPKIPQKGVEMGSFKPKENKKINVYITLERNLFTNHDPQCVGMQPFWNWPDVRS